jgi:hypothetical protein
MRAALTVIGWALAGWVAGSVSCNLLGTFMLYELEMDPSQVMERTVVLLVGDDRRWCLVWRPPSQASTACRG